MGPQKVVGFYNAPAVAGDMATPDQAIYQACNYTAEGSGVKVGKFVFAGTNPATQAKATGTVVLGLVQRVINYVNMNLVSGGTLELPEGSTLTVAVKGDFWIEATGSATVGQKVLVDKTDGSISFGTAASGNKLDTGFVVKTPASASGDMIIISNWGLGVTDLGSAGGVLGVANGGTGLSSLGTAGQVMKVNSGATGLEWGNDATA